MIINKVLDILSSSDDIVIKHFYVNKIKCTMVYIDDMVDKQVLCESIIAPLTKITDFCQPYYNCIQNALSYPERILTMENAEDICQKVCGGQVALIVENTKFAFIFDAKSVVKRSISEPPTQSVIKGPREGFIEDIKSNIILLRKRLQNPKLSVKMLKVGEVTFTDIAVMFIKGIASPWVVNKVIKTIKNINIDGIIDSSFIADFLQEHKYSIFSQSAKNEKPDIVTSKLLEGRVAIIVDGSPIVLTVPYILLETLQDSYDYYTKNIRSTMLRIIRVIGGLVGVLLPSLFVAMQSFHYHLLPVKFMITLVNAISGIPFTPPIEMFIVLIIFEILHQASVRMPRFIGTALSVVGAIVLGDTAVKAGLISSPAVLILALSAIGIHCVPESIDILSILRMVSLIISSLLGLFGLVLGSFIMIGYLASFSVYGSPYLAPFAPNISSDLKDGIFKAPLHSMIKRPYSIKNHNRIRQREGKHE